MRDRLLIVAGLVLFIGLFTFPIWNAAIAGIGTGIAGPQLQLPTEASNGPLAR